MKDDIKNRSAQDNYQYAKEAMSWHGWGSPVGLGLGFALVISSVGLFLWMLRLADIIK